MCHSVPVDVLRSVMVDDPARPRVLLKVVRMRYAKLKMPSWRMGILEAIHAILCNANPRYIDPCIHYHGIDRAPGCAHLVQVNYANGKLVRQIRVNR